jgi:uncharacterized membrane protein YfcA
VLELALQLLLGFGIGLSLGLLGGGGSILTVPALVYVLGQPAHAAVTTSLAIVGANGLLGASFHSRQGTLNWRVALVFGGAGMAVAYLAAGLSQQLSPAALLVAFAGLMLVIGALMLVPPPARNRPAEPAHPPRLWVVLASGAAVGLLTGILGVGGGFLIVPALVMLVGLPMSQAVGTSLVIIALNSLAGLLGHVGEVVDLRVLAVFVAAGLAGTFAGARLAGRLPALVLRRAFGGLVVVLALFLLVDNVPRLFA